MIIERNKTFSDILEITLQPHIDDRGFFTRIYDAKIFKDYNVDHQWVQENHSKTLHKGTIRGLHFQLPPFSETKIVRCIKGRIQDVFVDLRKESKTFGKWSSTILSEDNWKCILIPRGFAHGFCTMVNNCEVLYKVDNYYSKEKEVGLIWSDEEIDITWCTNNPILSDKDKKNLSFNYLKKSYINKP